MNKLLIPFPPPVYIGGSGQMTPKGQIIFACMMILFFLGGIIIVVLDRLGQLEKIVGKSDLLFIRFMGYMITTMLVITIIFNVF